MAAAEGDAGAQPRLFMIDAMLGSLARKLRMMGFDAEYAGRGRFGGGDIAALSAEGRILVTRSGALAARARGAGAPAVVLPRAGGTSGDEADLAELARQSGIGPLSASPDRSRCAACNGTLARAEGPGAPAGVPPRVAEAHSEFWRCSRCSKVYWDGTHMRSLGSLAARLNG